LIFNLGIYIWDGHEQGITFLTGYIIEKSLSVDNLFVFLLIFTYFGVPKKYQHKILFWGVLGAIIMRAIFIFSGIALIERFHVMIYIFGAFLIFTGIKMAVEDEKKVEPEKNIVLKIFRKIFPVTKDYKESRFFVHENGKWCATPMFVVLLVVESFDVVFAADSIPAILAISRESFIVFTSNIFAILGLRALYFALAQVVDKFCYLQIAISIILTYVGIKMVISDFYKISTVTSLLIIAAVFIIAIIASVVNNKRLGGYFKMQTISQLKSMALEQLKGKWTNAVIAALVFYAITFLFGGVGIFTFHILTLLVIGPLYFGLFEYFMRIKRQEPAVLENLFDGFKKFIPSFLLVLLINIFVILWALLLIIPGIIAALSYSQAFFILIDNPELSAVEAIKKSKAMMYGHKWRYFVLSLSFIGWGILAILTAGIGFLWLLPYMLTTIINFYDELKGLQPAASAK
ncbi:MAG: TerC/Alx family metal homeostasis membrane protein, partial [Proteobacteria bacterium]|nr:TerC/Alx family metal homeostasis membrane protein [Pseudomonadota bacterium]